MKTTIFVLGTLGLLTGLSMPGAADPDPQDASDLIKVRPPFYNCGLQTVGALVGYEVDITKTFLHDPPPPPGANDIGPLYAAHDLTKKAIGTFEALGQWNVNNHNYWVYKIYSGFSLTSEWCDPPLPCIIPPPPVPPTCPQG